MSADRVRRVLDHTVIASPWMCPEISMRLITHECPLWLAREEDVHAIRAAMEQQGRGVGTSVETDRPGEGSR